MEFKKRITQFKNSKGLKTTLVAIMAIALGLTVFTLFFLDKLDKDELTIAIAGLGTFTAIVGNLLAKDADKSHTEN